MSQHCQLLLFLSRFGLVLELKRAAWRRSLVPAPAALFAEASPFDVHLQWFAAEDEGRTEEPTEHKLRKAREEGKVAKSVEVSSSLVLLFG